MFLYNCICSNNNLITYGYNDIICVLNFGPLNHPYPYLPLWHAKNYNADYFFVNVMFTDYLYLRNAADIYFVMDQILSPE